MTCRATNLRDGVKVIRAEARKVLITELGRGSWEVVGRDLYWIRDKGETRRGPVTARVYGSAGEARRAVEGHDKEFARESGRNAVSQITWRPRTPLGKLWVKNLG